MSALQGKRVLAVSGIGNPQSFETAIRQLGADVAHVIRLPDHGGKPSEVWRWIKEHYTPGQWILMTEKDAMRWKTEKVAPELRAQSFALRMDIALSAEDSHWQALIGRIKGLCHETR